MESSSTLYFIWLFKEMLFSFTVKVKSWFGMHLEC